MLNGVGGNSIEQAQKNLSYQEYLLWRAYREKFGSLNQGMRTEHSMAMLASLYANSKSKKTYHIHDFSPHTPKPEPKEISIEEFTKV